MTKRFLLAACTLLAAAATGRADERVDPYDQSKVPLEVEPPADFKGRRSSSSPGSKPWRGPRVLRRLAHPHEPVAADRRGLAGHGRDGWPKNEAVFDGAAALVFYMDGRNGHPVVQNDAKGDRMDRIQKLMDKGVGWVNLHYAVDYLPKHGKRVLGWMGGYYEPDYSINPHWDASIRSLPKHEITRGVKPFVLRDEWYYNMRFADDMEGVTPILTAIPPDNTRGTKAAQMNPGRPEHMAWAYDRPDGGRGFGFTGGHFHRNWADPNFRRVVVNAILWSAKVDVPEGGAKVEFDPADLNKNLDKKGKEFKPIEPPPAREPKN